MATDSATVGKLAANSPDDLEAVRVVVDTLGKFVVADQERILRWAQEKLGIGASPPPAAPSQHHGGGASGSTHGPAPPLPPGSVSDIKTFMNSKQPRSDNQFAAAVAYYHQFEATAKKDNITAADLVDACRKVGRQRMKKPGQTLINAHGQGLLDKAGRGGYSLSTVGENLVAVTLPSDDAPQPRTRPNAKQQRPWAAKALRGKKAAEKKVAAKKAAKR